MKLTAKLLFLIAVYLFLYAPMAVLIAYSFNDSNYFMEWKGFTFKWYLRLLAEGGLWEVALNSLLVATLSATVATALGTVAAVSFYRYPFFGKRIAFGLIFVLIMMPDIVMAIALLLLFVTLGLTLGFQTLSLAHVAFCLPFVVVTVYSRLRGFDRNIIEAARDLGASEGQVFRSILLPLITPAVLAGWLLSFTLSMDDVIISFFVTGPGFEILPLRIFSMVRLGVKPEINAICTILFVMSLVIISISQLLLRDKK